MWFEIFKFELKYRAKRIETYVFFVVVFLFSIIAFNFIFEGQSLGLVKENAPYVIAKIMAIVSGFFMLITSMVMGVPILRDFEHKMESLLFVNPIKKRDYLLGRYLGSFVVLIFIFSGLIWGMMLGESLPWRDTNNILAFNFWNYLQPFLILVLPSLFFSGSIFFVSGMLSRKMIVVYTQGLAFFMVSILGLAIDNSFIASILDPLCFRAIDEVVEFWSIEDQNLRLVPLAGAVFYNRVIWVLIGIIVLIKGYSAFNFQINEGKTKKKQTNLFDPQNSSNSSNIKIPNFTFQGGWMTQAIQLKSHSLFYCQSILREASFWAIVICGVVTIFINSINIGTIFGVNSFPTTYLIVEELKEMAIFFFLMILVFYPGELIWKERSVKINGIYDALPMSDFVNLAGKFIGLILTYILLLLFLMLSGIAFQALSGYYHFELGVYFFGLFFEILSFLVFFVFLTFFFQVITNSKFIGQLLVVVFFIVIMLLAISGLGHGLYKFGGIGLQQYSDMNGYGHFLKPYLWFKLYWFAFCILLFVVSVLFNVRGMETSLKARWKLSQQRLTPALKKLSIAAMVVFFLTGSYIFYNTNILNTYFSISDKEEFRVAYELTLKEKEYLVQPKIIDVHLKVELYPQEQNYSVEGFYILKNKTDVPIHEIHLQKALSNQEELVYVRFKNGASANKEHQEFGYFIYKLNQALEPGDSLRMEFKQTGISRGFTEDNDETHLVANGTFFDNDRFPSLGYNRNYELRNEKDRKNYGLNPRLAPAKRNDPRELVNGKSGDDGSKINFEMIVGTDLDQTAIAPGVLQKNWTENNRSYFHFKMDQPMINFYSIVSARYEVLRDQWTSPHDSLGNDIDLEIYYHKGHEYNLDRMMQSMKSSFDYFNKNFSPYPYQQMRIMEYPRYAEFAQSFPNTVPYSEAIGFVLDIDDAEDPDMPFFITAHELAHQWWGLRLVAANVQGQDMILETLAQYSALMVMKEKHSETQVTRILDMELKRYLNGRRAATKIEWPLELVGGQEYIYYSKGAINMYALQDYISEDSVNLALSRFLKDWNSVDGVLQKDRYPTTIDLLKYFSAVTPDSLQYLITDLFKTNIFFENKIDTATFSKVSEDQYKVNLVIDASKIRVDSLGVESIVPLDDWIDIGIYGQGKNGEDELIYLEKHKINTSNLELEIKVNQLPTKVGIDPLIRLIDKKIEDNMLMLEEG